jgi:hypothetical protein
MSDHKHTSFAFRNPVYIADQDSFADAMALIKSDVTDRLAASQNFNKKHRADLVLAPVHSEQSRIHSESEEIYLWIDRETPKGVIPDFNQAIAVIIDKQKGLPSKIVFGKDFQGVLEYKASCCGGADSGFSSFIVLHGDHEKPVSYTRDAISTKPDMREFFKSDKIVCSTELLKTIYCQYKGLSTNFARGVGASQSIDLNGPN